VIRAYIHLRTHTHQTKRRASHNTSPLTKPLAELEIKVDVKYFISYKHNFIEQKRKYMIFLDIGEILEKGVHESSVCSILNYIFEIRSQVISGNHWVRTEGWTDTYTSNQTKGIT
jgi:hypothetical protein